jgi:hypothetical protein
MSKALTVDAIPAFKSTTDDFPRWELSILQVANRFSILAHLFEEQELKNKFPAMIWTPCAENPGTIDSVINSANKENSGLSLSDQITLYKFKAEKFKEEQAAADALRLAVVTSLPEAVRSLYETTSSSGIFAPLKTIYQAVKTRYGVSDTHSLRELAAKLPLAQSISQSTEQFISLHARTHKYFADSNRPMSEFEKLDKLKMAAEASAPRYDFPLCQYNINIPQAEQTFHSLATLLVKFDTENPQGGIAYVAKGRALAAKAAAKAAAKGVKRDAEGEPKGKLFCTCHGQCDHDTAHCNNGGKPAPGKGPLKDQAWTGLNVDGTRYVGKKRS